MLQYMTIFQDKERFSELWAGLDSTLEGPVIRTFNVSFVVRIDKLLNKQPGSRLSWHAMKLTWRHCNELYYRLYDFDEDFIVTQPVIVLIVWSHRTPHPTVCGVVWCGMVRRACVVERLRACVHAQSLMNNLQRDVIDFT